MEREISAILRQDMTGLIEKLSKAVEKESNHQNKY